MKASELMVGDWVFTRGQIEQVTSIYDGYICTEHYEDSHDYYFDPIPITPEILEKNGFRFIKADTVCPADRYWWAINGTRDGAMVEITIYNPDVHGVKVLTKIHTQSLHESGVNTVHSCDIESVHELQHALRLCGIEKKITL